MMRNEFYKGNGHTAFDKNCLVAVISFSNALSLNQTKANCLS